MNTKILRFHEGNEKGEKTQASVSPRATSEPVEKGWTMRGAALLRSAQAVTKPFIILKCHVCVILQRGENSSKAEKPLQRPNGSLSGAETFVLIACPFECL